MAPFYDHGHKIRDKGMGVRFSCPSEPCLRLASPVRKKDTIARSDTLYESAGGAAVHGRAAHMDSIPECSSKPGVETPVKVFSPLEDIHPSIQDIHGQLGIGGWFYYPNEQAMVWTRQTFAIHDVTPENYSPSLDRMLEFYQEEERERLKAALIALETEQEPFDIILALQPRGRKARWVRIIGRWGLDESGHPMLFGAIQDIHCYKEAELQLKHGLGRLHYLAHHDPLTGLPNRLLFNDRLQQSLLRAYREKRIVAVLMLDLDGFKTINDSLGHDLGDRLIQVVAKRLRRLLRVQDTAARIGGDEFVIILESVSRLKEVTVVADKILKTITRPLRLGIHELTVSASIGIALYPADGDRPDTLLKYADIAMYRAKELGKNNYQFFTSDLNRRALQLAQTEQELRSAVCRNQFLLHYQPVRRLKDGAVVGVEALVRWQHPSRGLLPPDQFIGVAEETGLITPMGRWILEEACRQFVRWQEAGLKLQYLSVNLSAVQFRHQIHRELKQILTQCGMDPQNLVLDVSESLVSKELAWNSDIPVHLQRLGVRLSIDDFGSGLTCLQSLARLPLASIKIDTRFTQYLADNARDRLVASSAVVLAHEFGVEALAEGIDSSRQLELLRTLKCDLGQGYLWDEPMSAEQIQQCLKTPNRRDQHVLADLAEP